MALKWLLNYENIFSLYRSAIITEKLLIEFATKADESYFLNNTRLDENKFLIKIDSKEIITAKNDNRVIGYLIFDYLWFRVPFISFIKVNSKHRQAGVGKSMLEYLEKYLVENGHDELFSSSMETAEEAQAWHKQMGFVESGIIHNINNDNIGEIFFKKELKSF